jgi:hypothetical protein
MTGEVRPWIFEREAVSSKWLTVGVSYVKMFFLELSCQNHLTAVVRMNCVSTGGCGQAADKPRTSRGQAVDILAAAKHGCVFVRLAEDGFVFAFLRGFETRETANVNYGTLERFYVW